MLKKEKIENDDSVQSQTLKSVTVPVPTCGVSASSVEPPTSKTKITKNVKTYKVKYMYYNETYIKYGFIPDLCDPPLPLCVICNQTLSNRSMQPSVLHRHSVTNHGEIKDKPAEFFKRKAENVSKISNVIHILHNHQRQH